MADEDDFMIVSGGVRYRPEDAKRLKLEADKAPAAATPTGPAEPTEPPAAPEQPADGPTAPAPAEATAGDGDTGDPDPDGDQDGDDASTVVDEKKAAPRNKARGAQNKAAE